MAQQGYGYMPAQGAGYYKPKQRISPLASAAGGGRTSQSDPFGLLTDTTNSAHVAMHNATPQIQVKNVIPAASTPGVSQTPQTPKQPGLQAPTAPLATSTPYDINTDVAYQTANSLTGFSDQQAQAEALKQKQLLLKQYGDPNLAQSLLGDSTLAQAAAQNPTSTLAGLGQQRDRNTHDLTEGLNQQNLAFGGYRITQEQQAAQDFQNALAQAAAGVNSGIGGIDSQLASVLGQNQAQRIAAMNDAYNRHATDPGAVLPPDAGGGGDGTDLTDPNLSGGAAGRAGSAFNLDSSAPNVDQLALVLAAAQRGRRPVAY